MPVPTPHIEAKKGEIARNVLMPGDPLRAKYVAEHFLEDARLVNQVRNVYAYTGTYKGKELTVMASGMGMRLSVFILMNCISFMMWTISSVLVRQALIRTDLLYTM